ncbi:MAG: preprotein translocase subunit YajC, partial [Eubacteriales bacterium]|nr:preprotein translocase subunit YajC [Eubacteriales bacterium]
MIFTVALTEAGPGGIEQILSLIVPLALMFGLMYLLLIRPQRKKEKKLREQIDAMVVG